VPDPAASPPADDPLARFLDAVRRPLAFLAAAPATTAARTQLPGRALAARGRDLYGRLPPGAQRERLEALCAGLEQLESADAARRRTLADECQRLLAQLIAAPPAPPDSAPSYRASSGDLAAALTRLDLSVQFAKEVGPRRAAHLRKFGIATVEDLLYHLPFRYEDRRRVCDIAALHIGEAASVIGEVAQLAERSVGRGRRRILEGVLRDPTGLLGLTWYNQVTYFRSRFRAGQRLLVHGKVERSPGGGKRIVHPEIDPAPDESVGAGVLPVYEKPTSMTVGTIRRIVQQAVRDYADLVPSVLPERIGRDARLLDAAAALRALHLPDPQADIDRLNRYASPAHRALVFDELFFLQLGMGLRRRQTAVESGLALARTGALTDRLAAVLPFTLTGAQHRVIEQICADLARPHPMHRLVQGDVGSGKTIVALFAALVAIEHGYQAAFMAPTELLAEQHFATIGRFVEALGVRAALLTGEAVKSGRKQLYAELESGAVQLAVGTHALIQEGVRMPGLALGIVDEQHRFGVLQRAAVLRALRGEHDARAPHILLMTATPIPRTLAMTIYGDLDVSILDELPPGRKPVRTMIFNEAERGRVYQLVKQELDQGRQGYVVYPLVEASEKEDLRDATTMARELGRTVFAGYRVGLLHGRMKADEKDAVMRRFRAGDLQLLFSTTVIEVGVDVPNASVMVVEHADRFGLSQLHQLRGRVGRGSDHALCLLVAPYRRGEDVYRRLKAMRDTSDGFKIAEVDLDLRGPGEFLGTRQHGLPDFRVSNLIRDTRTLTEAREAAERWLALDPSLRTPESAALRAILEHRWKGRLGLAEIG
jgi:ATP-dependent DNA helicase RecG